MKDLDKKSKIDNGLSTSLQAMPTMKIKNITDLPMNIKPIEVVREGKGEVNARNSSQLKYSLTNPITLKKDKSLTKGNLRRWKRYLMERKSSKGRNQ